MKPIFTTLLIILSYYLFAQEAGHCKDPEDIAALEARAHEDLLQFRTNPFTDNYDLKYHRLEWTIDPRVYYIRGTVTSYFVPTRAGFNEINFELSRLLTVNNVKYRGQNVPFSLLQDDRLQISLPRTLPINNLDSISITYEGVPPRTGFGSFSQTFHAGVPIIWTLSEPYGSKDWWPSKMDLSDKIDSIDVLVKTPQAYRVASNGLLVSEIQQDTFKTFHWKHRYPITAYLVAIGVTNYASYSDYVRLPTGDSLEVLNYVYPEQLESIRPQTIRTVRSMELFNRLFDIYPFAKEKYGHAQFGFGGGEEHQTMSFMGGWSHGLQAHELAHQWFGDKVTCGSWRDIWLNEGFATYLEGLTQEAGIGTTDFKTWLRGKINNVSSQPGGSVWVDDTTSVSRIFNGRLSYDKGAMLLHMLRWKLGDSTFFRGCRNYLNDPKLAYGYAKTEDLQGHLEAASGQNLSEFFKDWFFGQGYPSYRIEWQAFANNFLRMAVVQTTSHPSVSFFEMPIPIQIRGANGEVDTLILNHTSSGQFFGRTVEFPVTELVFDPDLRLISANNQVNRVLTSTKELEQLASQILLFPNPAQSELSVDLKNLAAKVYQMQIFDAKGSLVQTIIIKNDFEKIDISNFLTGMYLFKLQTDKGAVGKTFVKQ
jgi:aminopeptidase N